MLEAGNGASHELIKQGRGKSHVPMRGAVDHAFFDQAGTHWPQLIDFDVHEVCDITGAVRAWPEFCHGAQVRLFPRGKPVKPDTEEIFIQSPGDQIAGVLYHRQADGRSSGMIPRLVPPLLQKIGAVPRQSAPGGAGAAASCAWP